ncbi:MAG: flavodoxin-dependent (E)-4-hydroxy-3-methylbut-2-enyl-diphosphate synthase [Clostridia bacterium]|nr:flavodoxin-dependent (E)-4-hydroxy-3-methylbut-2-enyl-diphosphate synthase [Clostridia bacterium]
MYTNKTTKRVNVGKVAIGGGATVSIQSMLAVPAHNIDNNVRAAKELEAAGCEILRISVPDKEAVKTLEKLKESVNIPIVADIHFDWRLAVLSAQAGADKIRINPGNIGDEQGVLEVVKACKEKGIPIRIGVNSGSLEKNILAKYGKVTPEALVESGLYHIKMLEKYDFDDIVLSLKSSDVKVMYNAYVLAAEDIKYPLHLGVTEAGTENIGVIKSSAGIGGLLLRNIGDTIRISLTDNPVKEVYAAQKLLNAMGLRRNGIQFISCPTCGRTEIDLIGIANRVQEKLSGVNKNITVAVMGCVVNGPGEAAAADIGIAGGKKCGVLFKKGKIISNKIPEDKLVETLVSEIEKM